METTNEAPVMWAVRDLNQNGDTPRVHRIGGRDYFLWSQKATPVPPDHAVAFLRDPAFEVVDENGIPQVTLPAAENIDAAKKRPALEPDETIAKYAELQQSALLARAKLRPGGERFTQATKRDVLVDFLTNSPAIGELAEHQKPRSTGPSDYDPEAMTDAEAKAMLPKSDVSSALMGG